MKMRLWEGDNSHFVEVTNLKLQPNGGLVNNATVEVRILDDGNPVNGYSDPLPLTPDSQTDGRYTADLPSATEIVAGTTYEVVITADAGSAQAEWRGDVRAREREVS